jgi:hypothetical protein
VTRREIIPHLPTRAIPDLPLPLPPLPLFDSIPQKSLPFPSIPFAPSPRLAETPASSSEPSPPPPIPPLHAPGAPTGCDSFPWRQRIPSLFRFFIGSLWTIGFRRIPLVRYPSTTPYRQDLLYPRYRFEEPSAPARGVAKKPTALLLPRRSW